MGRLANRSATLPRGPIGGDITQIDDDGIGLEAAWLELRDRIIPTAIPTDHPRYLSFIPGAPTVAAVLADMTMGAASIYAGSELEAGELVRAERAALRWLSDLVGLPARAHGSFVSGGSAANLSGLVAARHARKQATGIRPDQILAGGSAHSSVYAAAEIMGCDYVGVSAVDGRFTADGLAAALEGADINRIVAVVATAGATNDGSVDDLAGISALCRAHGIWLHVDAAYGGAALLSARTQDQFKGIELADSVTINPHKWLFTPFDSAAILYRTPGSAKKVHAQRAPYLEAVANGDNPSDLSIELSRRARGIPLWMSLVANGTKAYRDAVDRCLDLAEYAQAAIQASPHLELAGPANLSIVLFRRVDWRMKDYQAWSELAIQSGVGLVTPTQHRGHPSLRLCFVNPTTTEADIDLIISSLAAPA
jgi:L-2,4-diaminobutyrate decarboxylase